MRILLLAFAVVVSSFVALSLYLHSPHVAAAPVSVEVAAVEAPAQIVPVVVHTVAFMAPIEVAPVEAPADVVEAPAPAPVVAPVAVAVPVVAKPVANHAKARKHHKRGHKSRGKRHPHWPNWDHPQASAAPGDAGTALAPVAMAGGETGLVKVVERYLGSNPTGWRHEWCAQFLNAVALPAAGLQGTGDARAISFEHWGRPARPAPGAVAVFPHHVTVVVSVNRDGTFDGLGGNQGHRVAVTRFPMSRVIAWRSPS